MKRSLFQGVGCALVTPFKNGRIDEDAFKRLIDFQVENGTDALIVCGTTGEASTLTDGEMLRLIALARDCVSADIPVIAGAGSNNTLSAVARTKRACEAGADAILSVTPYYNKANEEGLIRHFTQIADASSVPVILYNVPSRTGVNLSVSTVLTLLKHPNIQGVKEASQNFSDVISLLHATHEGAYIYAGNDNMFLPMLALGARGVISVTANVAPAAVKRLSDAFFAGDIESARRIHDELLPITQALFSDVNPIPVKKALSLMQLIENELRLPLTAMSSENARALQAIIEDIFKGIRK